MDFHLYQSLESRDLYHCTYLRPKRQSSSRFECGLVKNVSLALAIWQTLQEHDGKDWETEEELLPSGHQAPKHKLSFINIKKAVCTSLSSLLSFAHPSHPSCRLHIPLIPPVVCTSLSSLLFIVLFIKSHILFLHILLFCTFLYSTAFYILFLFFTYIYALVWCYFYICFYSLHCPLSGPDLTYISLLIIACIIYYVTNK